MAKRQADWPLDGEPSVSSTGLKRARLGHPVEGNDPRNGAVSLQIRSVEGEQAERNGKNRLTAADEDGEKLQDVAQKGPGSPGFEETVPAAPQRQSAPVEGYSDLYLDTINRAVLDFD